MLGAHTATGELDEPCLIRGSDGTSETGVRSRAVACPARAAGVHSLTALLPVVSQNVGMAQPTIFVSSTFYDLRHIRESGEEIHRAPRIPRCS